MYCKKETGAILRSKGAGKNDLKAFSYAKLEEELDAVTPVFMMCMPAATYNPRHNRNKSKTPESIKPVVLSAAAKLISIHSETMNVQKQLTGVILKKAGCKKKGFARLSKTYDTMSYEFMNELFDAFAARFAETILSWKKEVEDMSGHPGYCLANDNVDWEVGTRQITLSNQ